jgi:hypothetical protein
MRRFNETPFQFGHALSMLDPEQPFMTILVKAAFVLVPNRACIPLPADRQAKIAKGQKFLDRHGNSLQTDDDLVPFKPRADCLFIGSAHAPGGEPVATLQATFGVGGMVKRLAVFGDRAWVREPGGGARLTEPEPFTEMPIREERAHGGPKSSFNRHGIGFAPLGKRPGARVPAANILDAGKAAVAWDSDVPSAGFGVLPRQLQPRRALAGTFGDDWLYRRRPLPPADFDPGFLNAARRDQQVEDFLVGDEELRFENLHPSHEAFTARLPGIRVRCFVNRAMDPAVPETLEFSEIITCLDTCIVEMPKSIVTLMWRGTLEVQSVAHERIRHLLVCQEPLSAPRPLDYYAALMDERAGASPERRPTALSPEQRKAKVDGLVAKGKEQAIARLRKGGADAEVIARVEAAPDLEGVMQAIADWIEDIRKTLPAAPDV